MSVLVATLVCVCGAANIWVESPLVRVFPNSVPTAASTKEARLHAARGERESFQICIRADENPVQHVVVEAEPLDKEIGAPQVRRVGFLHVTQEMPLEKGVRDRRKKRTEPAPVRESLWPDPLLDFEPFNLAPGETAAVWVAVDVARKARPRTHKGSITVRYGEKRKVRVPLTVEVFAFEIPETPSLRTAFTLDRKSISSVYGIDGVKLERWKLIYDVVAANRMACRLWDGGPLVQVSKDGMADTEAFKAHVEYVASTAHMNTIDIGAGHNGAWPFQAPTPGEVQDPLQFYLHDVDNWLQDHDWLNRAFIEVMPLPERGRWQEARDAYFRVKRNDPRVKRLLIGAGDPYFERYTDIWATPLRDFDPYLDSLLRQGCSLRVKQTYPAQSVTASSSGGLRGGAGRTSQPEDAYDGCLFTYWISKAPPTKSDRQWIQVDLKEPITTDRIKIIWKRGFESADIDVETSGGGPMTSPSKIEWRAFPPSSPYAQSWAEGTLKSADTFQSIRFEFPGSFAGGPVGITELLFGENVDPTPPEHIEPLELWLSTSEGDFPSFAVEAHPVEPRILPWICWGHQSAGLVHAGLCRWPAGWTGLVQDQPLIWPERVKAPAAAAPLSPPATAAQYLFYPGRNGLIPSIRSELFRDGMEDYEYLVALNKALAEVKVKEREAAALCARRLYPPYPVQTQLDGWARDVLIAHTKMGWALSALAKREKP